MATTALMMPAVINHDGVVIVDFVDGEHYSYIWR
jgi:hypothetical protein